MEADFVPDFSEVLFVVDLAVTALVALRLIGVLSFIYGLASATGGFGDSLGRLGTVLQDAELQRPVVEGAEQLLHRTRVQC